MVADSEFPEEASFGLAISCQWAVIFQAAIEFSFWGGVFVGFCVQDGFVYLPFKIFVAIFENLVVYLTV